MVAGTQARRRGDGHFRDVFALLRRTILGTVDFSGRSRRLELAWYCLASMFAGAAIAFAVEPLIDWDEALIARKIRDLLFLLPLFALFARRLHDQGRSAWWVLLMPPIIAANIYKSLRANFHAFDPAWPDLGYWDLPILAAVLLMLTFMIMPGEAGENRYGPDPRLDPDAPHGA